MIFVKFLDPNPNKFDCLECLKYLFMTCEIQTVIHGTSEGMVVILDAVGLSLSHIANISINLMGMKKVLFYIQEAAPVRLKAIHVLNTMPMVDTLLNLVKPFMKKELLNLVSQQHVTSLFFLGKEKYKI